MADPRPPQSGKLTRREFVRRTSVGAGAVLGAAVAAGPAPAQQEEKRGDMTYRALGQTGLKVSTVCFGSYGFNNPAVLEAALDAGVNYIDTAGTYQNGQAERNIGEIMKKRRQDAYIVTKWVVKPESTKEELLAQLDASLKRLQTHYVDAMQVYAPGGVERMRLPALFEAWEQAKQQGKIKFTGVSEHKSPEVASVLQEVAKTGKFDVPMCKYNFVESPELGPAIEALGEKNIRATVFKVKAGDRQSEFKEFTDKGVALHMAAVKWALKNPNVASVVCGMLSFEDVKKWTKAAVAPLTPEDERLLRRYAKLVQTSYCRFCGTCESRCPRSVAVGDIMRYAMYFKYYGLQKDAMTQYASLPAEMQAAGCASCNGPCMTGCPHGLPTRDNLIEAHALLT